MQQYLYSTCFTSMVSRRPNSHFMGRSLHGVSSLPTIESFRIRIIRKRERLSGLTHYGIVAYTNIKLKLASFDEKGLRIERILGRGERRRRIIREGERKGKISFISFSFICTPIYMCYMRQGNILLSTWLAIDLMSLQTRIQPYLSLLPFPNHLANPSKIQPD